MKFDTIFYSFLQLKRALEIRPIIDELAQSNLKLFLSEEKWKKVEEIANILHHPYHISQQLQKVNYTMSDFYASWHQLKLLFTTLAPKVDLARYLLREMNNKKHDRLLQNPQIVCSVFLDPRFKSMLTKSRDESYVAKLYLVQLWERIANFEKKHAPTEINVDETTEIPTEFNFDLLEQFMRTDDVLSDNSGVDVNNKSDIMTLLNEFESQKPEPIAKNIFEYWEEKKYTFPELYKLAKVVHSVPPAQASCERTFSTLSFVFNKYRSKLSEQMLQNTLLIKLNPDLFYDVLKDDIEAKKAKKNTELE